MQETGRREMRLLAVVNVAILWHCLPASAQKGETVELVSNGTARAVVVLPAEASDEEEMAAQEIVEHIDKISGARLPIQRGKRPTGGATPILLGPSFAPESQGAIRAGGDDPASFVIRVKPDKILLTGLSPKGTLNAAYELLEQLGVRWFNPGEIGTVIPRSPNVAVACQETFQHPGFAGRHLTGFRDNTKKWLQRMRMGGLHPGSHGLGIKADRETEPELFMTAKGRRKIKVSHPEVLRRVIERWRAYLEKWPDAKYVSMGPTDGYGFGNDPWDADDMDPLDGKISATDRYVKFFNLVLNELQKSHPDVGLAFYCYALHMRPPVREKPNPRILPVLAPIGVCRFHSIENPICPERAYIKEIVEGWKALGVGMAYRGYLFNLADQGMPFSMVRQIRCEYPYYHKEGMVACRVECKPAWAYHGPSLYLAAKIMWNPKLDVDALLDDYFKKFYGPAAEPMKTHFRQLEEAYAGADYHTGNVFDIPYILTPAVMQKLDGTLKEAERAAAGNPLIARRVNMVRIGYAFGEANLRMMAAVNDFDFAGAKAHLDTIRDDITPSAINHDPPLLDPSYAVEFVDEFWAGTVEQGYERVTEGNEIAAGLPDEWLLLLDPFDGGEALGFHTSGMGTNNWHPIKTKSSSWSNQGLRYYKGEAWYRTSVEVPARYRGRETRLWLGGIDDQAKAWINGKELPLLARGKAPTGTPWEFDATGVVEPGKSNVIVVKVSNREIDEYGTGGITGPAMLWAARPK